MNFNPAFWSLILFLYLVIVDCRSESTYTFHNKSAFDTLFSENFDTSTVFPPPDWTVINGMSSAKHWQLAGDTIRYSNGTPSARCLFDFNQDEWLITPEITLPAGVITRLSFQWSSMYKWMVSPNNNADLMVKISTNNGSTWTTTVWKEDSQAVVSQSGAPWTWGNDYIADYEWHTSRIDLTGFQGQGIKIAFQYKGSDACRFHLDNICLYEAPEYDAEIQTNFVHFNGCDFYTKIPLYQAQNSDLYFYSAVRNNGTENLQNVQLKVLVKSGSNVICNDSSEVITGLSPYQQDTLTPGNTWDDIVPFPMDSLKTGMYQIIFSLTHDSTDADILNDTDTLIFEVADTVFARDNGIPGDAVNILEKYKNAGYGSGSVIALSYNMTANTAARSLSVYIDSNTVAGSQITGQLYIEGEFFPKLETDIYLVAPGDLGKWIELPFFTDGSSELLYSGTNYYAGIKCYDTIYIGTDQVTFHDYFITNRLWNGSAGSWDWQSDAGTPMIRLNISPNPYNIQRIDSRHEIQVQNYPNPCDERMIISILSQTGGIIQWQVSTLAGTVMIVNDEFLTPGKALKIELTTNHLPSGIYIFRIITGSKNINRRISVLH